MAAQVSHKLWTRDECASLERSGYLDPQQYELLEGALIQKMGKNIPHMLALQAVVCWLVQNFGKLVMPEPTIDVSPEDNPTNAPEPDCILLRHPIPQTATCIRPSDIELIVEISAASLHIDLGPKAKLYARAAIPEYWVLDVGARRLIAHRRPVNGEYRSVEIFAEPDTVATLAQPATTIPVAELFA